MTPDKNQQSPMEIPKDVISKWQRIVNLMAKTLNVPAGLIMRVDPPQIEVFISSESENNPYEKGERADLDTGLYCETVMQEGEMLHVPDALKDPEWDHNPDIELDMTFYLGFPIQWPDGQIFGTICVLDSYDNEHVMTYKELMAEFQRVIENDLRILTDAVKIENLNQELKAHQEHLEKTVEDRTLSLKEKNKKLIDEMRKRKHSEKELRNSETKLKAIFDHHYQLTGLLDIDGRLIAANRTALEFVGAVESELLGQYFWDGPWWDATQKSEVQSAIERARRGEFVRFETTHLNAAGEARNVDFSMSPVKDEDGKVIYIVPEGRDITELKRSEEKLKESEQHYRTLFENISDGIFSFNVTPDGKFEYTNFNPATEQMVGLKKEEIFGKTPDDLFDKNDAAGIKARYQKCVDEREIFSYDEALNLTRGKSFFNTTLVPLLDENDKVFHVIGVARDITERKQAEDTIRESEEKLRALFMESVFPVGVSKKGRHIMVNPKYLELFGYKSFEELKDIPIYDLIAPSERKRIGEHAKRRAKGENIPSQYETIGLKKDGTEFDMEVSVSNYSVNDEIYTSAFFKDLTEKKKAEESLRQSEEKYRLLVENSHDAIIVYQDANLKFHNEKVESLSGYSGEEIAALSSVFELIHPGDRERVLDYYTKRMQGQEAPSNYTYRIVHKNGSIKWVEINVAVINWEGKQASIGFFTDLTERKMAEEALKISEEKYNKAFYKNPNLMILADLESRTILEVNEAYTKTMGYSVEEVVNIPGHLGRTADTSEDKEKIINQLASKGHVEDYEIALRKKNGERSIFLLTSEMVLIENKELFILTGVDISERKKAEEELRASEEKFRILFEKTALGAAMVDMDGHPLLSNSALQYMVGYSEQELAGMVFTEFTHPDDIEKDWELFTKLIEGKRDSYQMEKRYIHKKGHVAWGNLTVSLVRDKLGKPDYIIGMIEDITQRKKAEEQRERALEELEKQRTLSARSDRLRSLGEMAAAISHELYQPLVGVRGRAEHLLIAQKRKWDVKPETYRKNLSDIIESADRMNHIIEHVRLFAREAGKPESSPVSVNEVVLSTIKLISEQFRSHGLSLKKRLTKTVQMIQINPYSLEEVLLNLMTNARDAVEERMVIDKAFENPTVTIGTKMVGDKDESRMQIIISDNGIGISVENMDRLFDPFFTTKETDKGTGLGLSIVKSIVEQYDGAVSIKSKLNQGTRVVIEFPVSESK